MCVCVCVYVCVHVCVCVCVCDNWVSPMYEMIGLAMSTQLWPNLERQSHIQLTHLLFSYEGVFIIN